MGERKARENEKKRESARGAAGKTRRGKAERRRAKRIRDEERFGDRENVEEYKRTRG